MNNLKLFVFILYYFVHNSKTTNVDDYWIQRQQFVDNEKNMQIGAGIQLSQQEEIVNKLLMEFKHDEFDQGQRDSSQFLPSRNFLEVQPLIQQSKVFQIIEKMPKGGVLHVHDFAMGSEEIYFNITFMNNLYFCNTTSGNIRFVFADHPPKIDRIWSKPFSSRNNQCPGWKLLAEERKTVPNVDELNNYIKSRMTLKVDDPRKIYKNGDLVWIKFRDIFSTIIPLLTYRPAFERYFHYALEEFYEDNIMYLEFRGVLPPLYELNGTTYDEVQVAGIYRKIIEQFKVSHPNFHDARFIYAPFRKVNNATFDNYVTILKKLHLNYPNFVAGFDLVGQEDLGSPLTAYVDKILSLPEDINLFFHSGETNWYGETDMNLVDAVLLGTKRIGHGYAIDKHPLVAKTIQEEQIAIEVSPISNQVLCLVDDLRNHPAANYLAQNYPIVISNDDPGLWGAKGLSYDFYEAFMAFTSRDSDLRVLKQLALNSLRFSAMHLEEQGVAMQKFHLQWNNFINSILLDKKIQQLNDIPYVISHK